MAPMFWENSFVIISYLGIEMFQRKGAPNFQKYMAWGTHGTNVLRIVLCNYGLSSRVSSSSLQTQNPPRCFLNGRSLSKKTSTFDDCPMVALLTNPSKFVRPWSNQRKTVPLRPWLHMLSIQSKITEKDRDKFNWNSAGVVRKTIRKVKGRKDHVNVSLAKIEHHRCATMFPCHCKQ